MTIASESDVFLVCRVRSVSSRIASSEACRIPNQRMSVSSAILAALTKPCRHVRQHLVLASDAEPIDRGAFRFQTDKFLVRCHMVHCWRPVRRHVIGDLSGGASTTSSILISESRVELAWANDVVDVTRDLSIGGSSATDVTLNQSWHTLP